MTPRRSSLPTPGTIVLAQGDPIEQTIGIVLWTTMSDAVRVFWLSNTRGAFWAEESAGDLTVAPLDERDSMADPAVDHTKLADILGALTINPPAI